MSAQPVPGRARAPRPAPVFARVVVGVDGGRGGRDAIALAELLAEGAALTLAHAYPLDEDGEPQLDRRHAEDLRDDAERLLEQERADAGIVARTAAIGDTSAARGLQRLAERLEADLIVTGSSIRTAGAQVLIGDVARGVLTHAPCAVAIAPADHRRGPRGLQRGIGVGYDGSPEARAALGTAAALARERGTTLRLLWTVRLPGPASLEAAPRYDWAALGEGMFSGAEAELARVLDGLDVPADGAVRTGVAADELARLADEVDLLVVGSRAWGPMRRVLLGSTSDRLAQTAASPLLVTPRPEP